MFSKVFWKDALERAIKTAAQFGLFALGTVTWTVIGDVISTSQAVGLAVAFGFVLSILTSVASAPVNDPESASLVDLSKG